MLIAADTHVHIYPNHDPRAVFDHGFRNLAGLLGANKIGSRTLILCLTEGQGYHAFRDLRDGRGEMPEGYACLARAEPEALTVQCGEDTLLLVAGSQVVTAERLEVLALTVDADLPDGRPVADTLAAVQDAGGVPVLSWAPGKWFGARGHTVRAVIDAATPGDLLLGDTTMRPTCWPEPGLMKRGYQHGLRIVAGSDPLPQPGEERYVGTYGIVGDVPFDPSAPVHSLRELLRNPGGGDGLMDLRGRRCGPLEMARRWSRHRKAKS